MNLFNRNFTLSFLVFFFISYLSFSQSKFPLINNIYFEEKLYKGAVLPHHSFMNNLVDEYIVGLEFQCKTDTYGRSPYDSLYRFPSYGIGFSTYSLGNIDKLGQASTLFALLDIPIYRGNKFSFGYQTNLGLAYANKSLESSIYNTALSSHMNFYLGADATCKYTFKDKSKLSLGLELSHISNGKTKTPNLGINAFVLSAAYMYQMREPVHSSHFTSNIAFQKHCFNIGVSSAYKSDEYLTNKKYPTSTLLGEYEYRFCAKYGIGLGGDVFYDQSLYANKSIPEKVIQRSEIIETGIHSGVFVHYSHMTFLVQVGKYTSTKSNKPDYFSRVGIRYQYKKAFVNLSMKSHKTTADFLEIGCGYSIIK